MSKFSIRLKELRRARKISQQRLADDVGMSKSSINMYERGEREPNLDMLERLSDYFHVDLDDLLGKATPADGASSRQQVALYDNLFPVRLKRFPLLGEIACGEPIFADEDHESYVLAGTDIQADFCLRCKGDSMVGARILDGDIVFIREQAMVENGEIAAVIIDNEATLKRVSYFPERNMLILKAENPKYADLIYADDELDSIRILGKAIAFQSDVH